MKRKMKKATIFMSCFTTHTILLLILVACVPFSVSQSYEKDLKYKPVIPYICKLTPFTDICLSSIQQSNALPQISDLKGVAIVMVKNILGNANDTLIYIEGLIKHTSDPHLLSTLSFCAETYIPLVKYTLPQAVDYVSHSRYGFASYCISYSMKEVNKCNKIYDGSGESPLGDRIGVFQKLGDVASSIINQLWKPPPPSPSPSPSPSPL